jgi:hypothetical protein
LVLLCLKAQDGCLFLIQARFEQNAINVQNTCRESDKHIITVRKEATLLLMQQQQQLALVICHKSLLTQGDDLQK